MILVDTSIWIDHFRASDSRLIECLEAGLVATHPFVIGELALGNLRQRDILLDAVSNLHVADVATDAEVQHFISRNALFGRGIGYVDVHLLASVRLTATAELWTKDRRLHGVAAEMGVAFR